MRGAERTFAAIAELYAGRRSSPAARRAGHQRALCGRSITTSPLQRLGVGQSFRRLLPLYPCAVERLKLPQSDVVLSSSSAFAHGVRVPRGRRARLLLLHAVSLRVV
jgi:hypothetical protein